MPSSIYDNLIYDVGGGGEQADYNLQALDLAQRMLATQRQTGLGLLDYVTETQRDPFSIVPALQMYGGAGGGTLAPQVALAQSGGLGRPSPYGPIAQNILERLAEFTGGVPINPATGYPLTPQELAYIRLIMSNQGQRPSGVVDPATGFQGYTPPIPGYVPPGAPPALAPPVLPPPPAPPVPAPMPDPNINPNTGRPYTPKEIAYLKIIEENQHRQQLPAVRWDPETQRLLDRVNRTRAGTTSRRAGRYLQGSPLGTRP